MLGLCRVRGLGRTSTLLTIANKKLQEICPQIRTINIYIYIYIYIEPQIASLFTTRYRQVI